MCRFKSGIVFRTGEVFTNPFTDSHEDLIALKGLKDNREARCQNWIRVEYVPDEKWEKFTLSVDEPQAPAWWTADDAQELRDKVETYFERLIAGMTVTDERPLLLGGQYIIRDGAKVAKADFCHLQIRGGTVEAIWGGTVKAIWGGTVKEIWGGTVKEIRGGTVKEIRGGTVEAIRGGTVEAIRGGTVKEIRGGTVEAIWGGTVKEIWGGTVKEIRGGTVEAIWGGTVEAIWGGTVKADHRPKAKGAKP